MLAARVTDNHVCPLADPKPHVGGPISVPGAPTVLIANLPAAAMGSMCVCVGPPDTIVKGSAHQGHRYNRAPDPHQHGASRLWAVAQPLDG